MGFITIWEKIFATFSKNLFKSKDAVDKYPVNYWDGTGTLPETNVATEYGWFEDEISVWGAMLVSGSVNLIP